MNSKLLLCVIQYDIGQAKIAVKRENSLKREYIEKVRKKKHKQLPSKAEMCAVDANKFSKKDLYLEEAKLTKKRHKRIVSERNTRKFKKHKKMEV